MKAKHNTCGSTIVQVFQGWHNPWFQGDGTTVETFSCTTSLTQQVLNTQGKQITAFRRIPLVFVFEKKGN